MKRGSAAAAIVAAALVAAPSASAQEVVSLQAQAMNGGWTLPAPGQRSAVCLVDSGFDPTQLDVRQDVKATTISGLTSTGPALDAAQQPVMHGTWMLQAAFAPADGAGMIGPTPGVPVIFVRAMRDGTGKFDGSDYAGGMLICDRAARAAGWRLASIALALGSDAPQADERNSVAQRVADLPAVPVAAVGNRPGVAQFPAQADGVVGVSAVSTITGETCAGTADPDPEAAGLAGPGCLVTMPVDGQAQTVDSAGTSGATVMVAAAIAQACDLAPELTPRECLALVQSTARAVPGGKVPDLRAIAAARGFAAPALTAPLATVAPPSASPSAPNLDVTVVIAPRWYGAKLRPKIKRLSGGRIQVTSPDKNRAASIWTNLRGGKAGKRRTITGRPRGNRVKVRVTQSKDGQVFQRSWSLKVPRRR